MKIKKRQWFWFGLVIIIYSTTDLAVYAVSAPTAKIVATPDSNSTPQPGDRFDVKVTATEVSSNLFASGQVRIKYPVDVVTPLICWEEDNMEAEYSSDFVSVITNEL